MAAKLLHSLTDDNLDLQKQIGCMNGIFQLFDRQHILTGGRHGVVHSHKGLHQGISDYNGATLEGEANGEHLRSASTEKIAVKNVQEKQRISNASSRASFSSLSRSSSSSSLDCIRVSQLESASFDRIIFPETPSRDPQFSRQNRDIRDLVKDSMYKAKTAEDPVTKDRDSPRLHSEMMNDLKESVKVTQHQEAPRHHSEGRRLMRSLSYHSRDEYPSKISRDGPRFSYDGREVNPSPLDSRGVSKSALKLKDLPRLSLDGSKAGPNSRSVHHDSGECDAKAQNPQHSARPPSVVAKLMGLETLPHQSVSPVETNFSVAKSYLDKERGTKNLWKEPNSPRWRSPDSSMTPLSRFPLEPAPWKHTEGRRGSQKPRPKTMRDAAKAEGAFPSVYSEIEKRLKDLEFTQSGKDLRALKQILEAMQSKKLLQTQKQDHEEKQSRPKHEARSVDRRKPHTDQEPLASTKRAAVSRHAEHPIVIMKPAKDPSSKSSQRESGVASSANVKNDRILKAAQISTRSQQLVKDGYAGSSPRLLQKKLELEKRARPPTSPDSTKLRRQPSKQLGEANSPGGRRRPKHSNIQESDDKLSEVNESMVRLNAKFSRTSTCKSLPMEASESILTHSIPTFTSSGEKLTEFGNVPAEHSSAVSVLDNGVHTEDSSSSVTYKVNISMNQNKLQSIDHLVQKLRRLNSSHDEVGTDYIASLCPNTDPDHRYISEILLASGLLGSTLTDFQFHPSGHPINPELFLVLEQTKVSKEERTEKRRLVFDTVNEILGRELAPAEPWLRRLKLTRTAVNAQKLLRELCSEIEALQGRDAKCSSGSSGEDDERWKGVVCKDVMHHESGCWMGFDDEVSGAVLDIERSIFKDLVNEIVIGEAASGLKIKPVGRRRASAK